MTIFIEVGENKRENISRYNSVMKALAKYRPKCASGYGYYGMSAVMVTGVYLRDITKVLEKKSYYKKLTFRKV